MKRWSALAELAWADVGNNSQLDAKYILQAFGKLTSLTHLRCEAVPNRPLLKGLIREVHRRHVAAGGVEIIDDLGFPEEPEVEDDVAEPEQAEDQLNPEVEID